MMPQVRSGWHLSFLTWAARPEVRVLQLPYLITRVLQQFDIALPSFGGHNTVKYLQEPTCYGFRRSSYGPAG
jgi:hypothetical protein